MFMFTSKKTPGQNSPWVFSYLWALSIGTIITYTQIDLDNRNC